jgi:hypothetical protein
MNQSESKGIVVCMVEDAPVEAGQLENEILFDSGKKEGSSRLSHANVIKYKGLEVSTYHNNAGIGYWGTYVN